MGVLRLFLALAVVLEHLHVEGMTERGSHAVSLFFILSGFYMALVLNEKYPRGRAGYWQFALARIVRLWPTYGVVLAVTVLATILSAQIFKRPAEQQELDLFYRLAELNVGSAFFLVATNLFLVGQDVVMFLKIENGGLAFTRDFWSEPVPAYLFLFVPQAWSIALELTFYAIAPFLVRRSWKVIVGFFAASLALKIGLGVAFGLWKDPWNYRFFPTTLLFFCLGALAYRGLVHLRQKGTLPKATALIPVLAIVSVAVEKATLDHVPGGWPLQVALVTCALPIAFLLWGRNAPDRWIGDLSYPIYVCHFVVLRIGQKIGIHSPVLLVLAVLVVSAALLLLIERPVENYRQAKIRQRLKQITPGLSQPALDAAIDPGIRR